MRKPFPVKRRQGMRADQLDLAMSSRAMGMSWVDIAAAFRDRYQVNGLTAMRLAHALSQRDVAERWNRRWPDDPKTFKSISYWENWQSPTGHAPALAVLTRLAELYQCAVMDLLADGPDFRHLDPHDGSRRDVARAPAQRALSVALEGVFTRLADADVEEVAAAGLLWADRIPAPGEAYGLLMKLSAGLGLAASARSGLAIVPRQPRQPTGEADLVGIWRSRHSGSIEDDHTVVLRGSRGRLVGQSLPHPAGARLRINLEVDGATVSGTWIAHRADGGTTFGTLRLTLEPARRRMCGRWLAFGERGHVLVGDWDLIWMERSVSGSVLTAHRAAA